MRGPEQDQAIARGERRSVRARVGRERRVLRIALAVSAVLHVLAIGIVGGLLAIPEAHAPTRPTPLLLQPPSGMRAVNLRPVASTMAPDAVTPPPPTTPVEPEPDTRNTQPAPEAVALVPADDRTAADRLAPRLVDPRIWRPIVLIPREPTLDDVQARIAAAVELLSDSALAEAERELRATDWTLTDDDGEKWGISPGVLHLGKLKIPLPIYYVEEWNDTRERFLEIEAQVDRARFLESFEDRVKKIRERRDRERREGQGGEGGTVAEGGPGGSGGGGGGGGGGP